jgi:hypothetical protein
MTDDLLDEATRLADSEWPPAALTTPVLRALVERVRAAEAERQEWADLWQKAAMSVLRLTDERDAARGKLDTVRERVKFHLSGQRNGSGISFILDDVLAILDGDPA